MSIIVSSDPMWNGEFGTAQGVAFEGSAYRTDEWFGADHWRASQFSPVCHFPAVIVMFPDRATRADWILLARIQQK